MDRKEFRDLSPPEAVHEAIGSLIPSTDVETVSLAEATGRVLAERIDAELDVPGFDRSNMDGYALRAVDTYGADEAAPARLTLVGEVHAGDAPSVSVEDGEAVEISTGAVMPPGADAMVPVERTDMVGEATVLVRTAVAPGDNVMFAGADVAAGERALGPGTPLSPREIGLLSALGTDEIPVYSRPTVGIVSTGDELVPPGGPLDSDRGEIYDVNSYTIAAAVEDAGGEAVRYPHVGDDWDAMEDVLRRAGEECDLVCSSGSTSASAVDVIYRVIEDLGELLLHGVSLKPGKPMLVGRLGEAGYVGLPGYPVSAMMTFRTFVSPAIRRAAGRTDVESATITGEMAVEARFEEGRRRLLPVGVLESGVDGVLAGADGSLVETDGEKENEDDRERAGDAGADRTVVYPVDSGSGATTTLARADGFVEVPAASSYVAAGESVDVTLFSDELEPPTVLGVGEDDPTVSRALDRVDGVRYLQDGSRPAVRDLARGVPDVAIVSGPISSEVGQERVRFSRSWGLLVPGGNPAGVEDVEDVIDSEMRFCNRTTDSGLRSTFDEYLVGVADVRNESVSTLTNAIDGYDVGLRAHESPARRVKAGAADVGLGLEQTAERLSMEFVALGTEPVRMLVNPDRREKEAIDALATAIDRESSGN